jgi:hypothetical protein
MMDVAITRIEANLIATLYPAGSATRGILRVLQKRRLSGNRRIGDRFTTTRPELVRATGA